MSSIKIVAFGDGVTLGMPAKLDVLHDCFRYEREHRTDTVNMVRESQTWRSIVARILTDWVEDEVEVVGAGVGGDTSARGLARLERDVLSGAPAYVLVAFGGEDALQGVDSGAYQENLEKMVDGIGAQGARPVLMTPTPFSERMTAHDCTIPEVRALQARTAHMAQAVRSVAAKRSLPVIDLQRWFLDHRLAYDHLYEGRLPDAVAQSAMASFVAGELLPLLGVQDFPAPLLCDYRKVYSDVENPLTRHNGFTDLTYFGGEFYLAFRTGARHGFLGLLGGKTLVLRSADGITWVKDAELAVEGFLETRDPKFLHVGDRLMVYPICHDFPNGEHVSAHYGYERMGPGEWSTPFECAPCVLWRPKKWRETYVAAGYGWKFDEQEQRHFSVSLLQSKNGRDWETTSTILDYGMDGNETELFVRDDTLVALSRTEVGGNHEMHVSTYMPSENRWETVSSGRLIHAPCAFTAGDRTMLMGRYCSQSDERFRELREDWSTFTVYVQKPDEEGYETAADSAGVDPARVEEYHHGLRTGIFVLDGSRPRLVMELLSAGDSSYTGVAQYGEEYVISDYTMHEYYPQIKRPGDWETPCDIYVSRIRFGE